MYTKEFDLAAIIRRGAARAGPVKGYEHRCRKQGCGFKELRATNQQSRCPQCGRALWPKAVPKDYRFHHLRHTNASSLLKLRESLPLVQDILGHADPETTRRIYGHLELDDKRRALAQLRFRLPAGNGSGAAPASTTPANGEVGVDGAPAVRPPESGKTEAADPFGNPNELSGLRWSGRQDLNLRETADVESMLDAKVVFAGRIVDPAHDEPRYLLLGVTSGGRHAALVFTRRGDDLRPISCRAMRKGEKEAYDAAT